MKKCCFLAGFATIMMMFSGCAVGPKAPFVPAYAACFNNTAAPLSTEFNSTPVTNLKCAEGSTTCILGLFAFGDCSIQSAARAGQLNTIEFADYVNFNVLGIYQKTTVTVYGK